MRLRLTGYGWLDLDSGIEFATEAEAFEYFSESPPNDPKKEKATDE